ncbi:hypothetical protein LX87_00611 [Larkinella arboricola]|uniref:Uncharacterized protein n=1 Tax=Larkinella arboricola TaxID=643671 RepID=A0A327X6X5_LARAB|nr:hypothetical protein [Larkinella arboricola]RAK02491.1 hypothetical protein LX87_00611 [Larkinella arboricola]
MKAATERLLIRWFHIMASIPILGYIYGPVAQLPEAALMVKAVILPLVILSGFWLWKGHWVKKWVGIGTGKAPSTNPRKPGLRPFKLKA